MANYKDLTRKCGLCRKWSLVGLIWGSENIRKRPGMIVDPKNKGSVYNHQLLWGAEYALYNSPRSPLESLTRSPKPI